jgi:hypothetical protein
MIERIAIALLTRLGSWLLAKALEYIQNREEKKADESAIDDRVNKVKDVLRESLDGTPLTPEQKLKFKESLRDLIRGGSSSGL